MPKGKKKKKPKPKAPIPESDKEEQESDAPPTVVDITLLPIWQIIPVFIGIFDRVAWLKMGLVVNPETQEIEKDLDQARAAIDSFQSLLTHLGDHIEPDVKKTLEARLTDLKLNFAQQT